MLADRASPLWLAQHHAGTGEQGEVERPAAHIPAVHVQRPLGISCGVARVTEIPEALSHAGGQVRLVKVGEPRRVVFAGGPVEGLLCPCEGGAAGMRVVARGVPVGFHD